jgi:hypothetical protein
MRPGKMLRTGTMMMVCRHGAHSTKLPNICKDCVSDVRVSYAISDATATAALKNAAQAGVSPSTTAVEISESSGVSSSGS